MSIFYPRCPYVPTFLTFLPLPLQFLFVRYPIHISSYIRFFTGAFEKQLPRNEYSLHRVCPSSSNKSALAVSFLLKSVTKIYFGSKSNKNKTFRTNAYVNLYLARFFLGSEKYDKQVVEKIRTQMSGQRLFFSDNRAVYEIIIQKYSTARHNTNDKNTWRKKKKD